MRHSVDILWSCQLAKYYWWRICMSSCVKTHRQRTSRGLCLDGRVTFCWWRSGVGDLIIDVSQEDTWISTTEEGKLSCQTRAHTNVVLRSVRFHGDRTWQWWTCALLETPWFAVVSRLSSAEGKRTERFPEKSSRYRDSLKSEVRLPRD